MSDGSTSGEEVVLITGTNIPWRWPAHSSASLASIGVPALARGMTGPAGSTTLYALCVSVGIVY